MPIIPVFRKLRQEDCQKIEVSLVYTEKPSFEKTTSKQTTSKQFVSWP